MDLRYIRNSIHITEEEQQLIKNFPVLIAGCGIGSYIAECLLRMGFENLTIADGDVVELNNLNRQNYINSDIGIKKVIALKNRLQAINPEAKISVFPEFINQDNLYGIGLNHKVAINALDFSSNIPFIFDQYMSEREIPVVHPYNLGWAGFLTVLPPNGLNLASLKRAHQTFELNVGEFIVDSLKARRIETSWLEEFLKEYGKIALISPPPQLSLGLYILSGMVSHIIFNFATRKSVKYFPEFYYLSMIE